MTEITMEIIERTSNGGHPLANMFPVIHFDADVVDIPANLPCISKLDIFLLACSIVMHIVDMCFDYNIAIRYFINGRTTYFVWTICLIILPSLVNVIVSKRMQRQDKEVKQIIFFTDTSFIYLFICINDTHLLL
jgi:hypothetical protein